MKTNIEHCRELIKVWLTCEQQALLADVLEDVREFSVPTIITAIDENIANYKDT